MDAPSSYQHLAPLYDRLFPLESQTLRFLRESLGDISRRRIVDAGCGTGLLARALADQGAQVFGFDLDPDLLAQAQKREGRGATFAVGDLRTWSLPPCFQASDALLSLGNTLPHLTLSSDLDLFLSRTAGILGPGAILILQVLDYEYLSRTGMMTLPPRFVDGWSFERRYEVRPDGLWDFSTSLTRDGVCREKVFALRPWTRSELEPALVRHGFRVEQVWGGFDRTPPGDSLPLVLEARLT